MRTTLGYGIAVNKNSTLSRESITIHDARLPLTLSENVIVGTAYKDRSYQYEATYQVKPTEPLAAVEVRVLMFDVFGDPMQALVATEVADMAAGTAAAIKSEWRAWRENDVAEFYASIAYVHRVRTQAGRIITADIAPVLAEATKFSKKFTAADLEPKAEQRP